ncbi:hypothetical protein SAMN05444149_11364 [Pseudosulfitobacter pseudonitzschiae]|uniref:Tetratricopeptide repeat protein n=2 Tax=Pseudosulfitobacter pseudonitzschiae TaxID=1402135 RepID=A0A073J9D9_9RHOB|nr:hypothetical protein SUH3_07475 [Pseudosulfitobacter pseudonitzschiae]SHG22150.1 hypothetical protein SAMN05444149_11364 [Pseudosulfitobacter pseudonitzschiae]
MGARFCILALVLAPVLVLGSASGALAQNHTPDSYAEWILKQSNDIQDAYFRGSKDQAMAAADALNAEVDKYADFMGDHKGFWLPDLLVARLATDRGDYKHAADVAAPMVTALDTPAEHGGAMRVEALLLLGQALYFTDDYTAAEPVLRSFVTLGQEPGTQVDPEDVTEAAYLLAQAATRAFAPDAAQIRRDVLDGFTERPGGHDGLYLRLWLLDFQARRTGATDDAQLLADARHVAAFMETSDEGDMAEYQLLYGMLGRIFADNADFDRAVPLLQARMDYMRAQAPGTPEYFWAAQNLAGIRNLQGDFPAAISTAQAALGEMDALPNGQGDDFAPVRSTLEQVIWVAADQMGEALIAQEALERAYVAVRQTRSANNPAAQELATKMDKALVDPARFVYAAELGLDRPGEIFVTADGDDVVSAVLAGRYALISQVLDRAEAKGELPTAMAALNRAYIAALLGDVGEGQAQLARVRAALADGQHEGVEADPWQPDFAEALLMLFARIYDPDLALAPLARLEARDDLPEIIQANVRMLRATQSFYGHDMSAARKVYLDNADADFARVTTEPWGVILGLGLLNLALELDDLDRARAFVDSYSKQLEATPDRALALVSTQMFALNADPDAMLTERGFQTMAFHLRSLASMLPEEHQWSVAARFAYASALARRGDRIEAAELTRAALESYRRSPWHQEGTAAFLSVSYGWLVWGNGNPELAQSIIAQAYASRDPATWGPLYWAEVCFAQAFVRSYQGRLDEARSVIEEALGETAMMARLTPANATRLHTQHADILAQMGLSDLAADAYDRAVAVLPYPEYQGGQTMAETLRKRAVFFHDQAQPQAAYLDMAESNALWFDRYDRYASSGADVARQPAEDRLRAVDEAVFGWVLSQSLAEVQPQQE